MFTKRFLLIIIILFQFIAKCFSKPIEINVINNNNVINDELEDSDWLYRLIINILGYSLILFPSALIVFLVKNDLCFRSVRENSFVKLFVFGTNDPIIDYNINESQAKLLPLSLNDAKDKDSNITSKRNIYLLMYCFLGLQISYLSWGLLQEKIMTTEYQIESHFFSSHKPFAIADSLVTLSSRRTHINDNIKDNDKNLGNEELEELNTETKQTYHIKFRNSQFLVLINRILAFIIAFSTIIFKNRNQIKTLQFVGSKSSPPLYQYMYCSLSNILSSWCQYEALKFVSFPTQVLSKACKLLPVMVMSQIIGGKRYRTIEYLFAISISLGMTMFLWSDHDVNSHSTNKSNINTIPTAKHYSGGIIILILYLTFDSFTSNWQGILFDKYKMSTLHMMAAVNFYSILLTSTSLTQQGDLTPAFQLVFYNNSLFTDCILLSLFSAAGQLFVFYTISTFGALVFVTIMTLRQAIAILLSCIIYDHSLAIMGFLGIVIVFGTLFSQIYWKSRNKGKR